LLDAVIFNLLIGNHDAHAKNFSLLYGADGSVRLAPLYDLVCTVYYEELTDKMAMSMGGQAKSELIFPDNAALFAKAAGLGVAQTLTRFAAMAESVLEKIGSVEKPGPVSERVAALIARRCESFRGRFRFRR
jgi:serine/threonine-protein kinase HipA